jgi:hypothetical protein
MKLNINEAKPLQLVAAAAAILLLVGGVKILKAFNPQPDPPGVWGMVGVTPSETIRINVVNMQFPGFPPGPCNVTLKFLDATGKILEQQTLKINSTQAASLDYVPVGITSFRAEVHPVVSVPATEPTGCSAVGSVEVFNTLSGETTVYANPIYISLPETLTGTSTGGNR